MLSSCCIPFSILILLISANGDATANEPKLNYAKTKVWGPGLKSAIVLPARYFFIHAIGDNGKRFI